MPGLERLKPEVSLDVDDASSFVLLPQGFPLFQASLVRSGYDLQILGPAGESALVGDYFADGSALPALARAGGGFMAGDLVASLTSPAGPASPSQPAHPVLASVVGHVADLTGAATVMHSGGLFDGLDIADTIRQGDYVFPAEGSLTIVFADGTKLAIQDGGQVLVRHVAYDPASISGTIELEAAGGHFVLTTGNLSEHPGRPIVVHTPLARIQIGAGSVAFQHDAAHGLDVKLLDDVNLQEDALVVDNAAGSISSVQAGGHITVNDDQQAPLLVDSLEHATARPIEIETTAALTSAESTDAEEVSPGGDPNALPGDPIVVSGAPAFFHLSPQPAPLGSPALLDPSLTSVDVPIVKHDTITFASGAVQASDNPGGGGSGDEWPEQLRDWEPLGLVWDVLGSAMVTGNAPALPYETDGRLIMTTEKLSMAGLALSPDQRPTGELEGFLGIASNAIGATTPRTTPADGSAIRAKVSLAAGSELSFDFFFDAGDTQPRDDFAVFSIGTHVYKLADVVGAGTQGATGWRTFVYKVSEAGTYTIGFASVNDAVVDNLSALYVDNVRINRTFGSEYVVIETTADHAGRILVLPPVLHDDMLFTSEDAKVATTEAALLANDQANDTFISLKIVAIDVTGTLGHLTNGPAAGSLIYSPGGRFDGLALGETAIDVFHYVGQTGQGATAVGTVRVTITGVNDAPVATGSARWTSFEDSGPTQFDVLANDDDVDSDDSSATLRIVAAQAAKGIVSFSGAPGAGLFYLAGSAFDYLGVGKTAVDTITYTITDRHGALSTATETVTVTGVNDAPVAQPDRGVSGEDSALRLDVLANDRDPDTGDAIKVDAVFGPASGAQVTINQDGSLTYDPRGRFDSLAAGQTTTDTFAYRISDGHGGVADALATITIIGINDAPVAGGDVAGTGATTRLTLPAAALLANDTDIDNGDKLHLSSVDGTGTIGHVSLKGGSVVYDAGPGFVWLGEGETAVDSFHYVVADTGGGFATGTVLVSVTGVNDPVTAGDDIVSATEDDRLVLSAGGVLTNDTDPDLHDVLRVVAVDGQAAEVGQPVTLRSGAQATIFASGRVEYDPGSVWNWLSAGETGGEQISYTVADGHGSVSTGQLTIVVTGVNDLPVAAADDVVADEDAKVRIGALANDTDPDLHDVLTIRSVILEAPGGANTHGTVRINPDNTLTYDPEGQFDYLAPGETATDIFQYVIDDGHGGRDVKTVTVTVHGVNDPHPVPDQELLDSFEVPAQGASVVPGATANFGVIGTAALQAAFVPIDDFGHALPALSPSHLGRMMVLTAAGSSGAGGGTLSPIEAFLNLPGNALPDNADKSANAGAASRIEVALTAADAADGKIELSFDWNFVANAFDRPAGTINDFAVFTVSDGVTWKVFTLSDAVRTDWGSSGWRTSVYDVTHDFAVAPGSTLKLTVGFAVLNDATPNNPSHLLLDNVRLDRPLGRDFEPDGPADGGLQTYRQAPTALPDASATSEDAPLALTAGSLLANDFQAHGVDRSTLHIVGVDAHSTRGAVIAFDGTQVTYDPRGTLDALSAGETVADVFHYTITDGNGGTDQGEVTVTVTGLNDAPVARADFAAADENGAAVAIDVLANDDDIDSDDDRSTLRIVAASASSGAAVSFGIAAGAALLYNPNSTNAFERLGVGETAIDTITYTIEDRHGALSSSTVQVTVSGSNDAPRAVGDTGTVDEDTVLVLSVLANDSDPDVHDVLRIGAVSTAGTLGHVTVNADGTLSYDPTSAFNHLARGQTATDAFTYTASDGHGGTSQASVTITVTGRNDAPVAGADAMTTTAAAAHTVAASTLLANDVDPDGDAIHVLNVDATSAHGGNVSFNGTSITYDPAGHFRSLGEGETAQDTFHYRLADLDGATGDGTVTVTVQGVNDAPLAVNDIATTDEDTSVKVHVLDNDSDPDTHDFLSVASLNTTGTRGQVTINVADGTITYDPRGQFDYLNAGQSAHDTFVYRVADGHGGFADATVDVTITGKPDTQSLVTSFETPFGLDDTKGTVTRPASWQETDGAHGFYRPTDASVMAKLEANGALIPALNTYLGLPTGTIPKDTVDNTAPANGAAIKLSVTVQAGDQISFDWMFDARDYTRTPPDGNQDNDFAIFTVSGGGTPEMFRLADVRSTGDLGATGWRSSIYTAPAGGHLTIGMASINDRIATDNSVLLVDNVRINRDFGEGYQVVDIQAGGRFETVVHT